MNLPRIVSCLIVVDRRRIGFVAAGLHVVILFSHGCSTLPQRIALTEAEAISTLSWAAARTVLVTTPILREIVRLGWLSPLASLYSEVVNSQLRRNLRHRDGGTGSPVPETENPPNCPSKKCRSTLWNKGGVDGRTRAARIKVGRSRRTRASKDR
jgi:hypothetical protein